MPQICKVCVHPERQAIDAVLEKGWPSYRIVGAQYRLSKDSLSRHNQRHLSSEDPILNNQNKSNGPGKPRQLAGMTDEKKEPEARQVAQVATHEKEQFRNASAGIAESREPAPLVALQPEQEKKQFYTPLLRAVGRKEGEPRQAGFVEREKELGEVLKQEKTSSLDLWAGWKPDPWAGWGRV